jgi:CubicO group peptidase (beta-lactamase class C family)
VIEGQVHPDFWLVARALETQLRQTEGGAAVCVYHRGEPVVDLWSGTRDPQGRPWEADTMAMSFSTTKGVAATVLHVLVDRGLLDYDDPVAKHWPEFAQGGKERITVRQVLCHQAALHHIRKLIDDGEQMLDWEHMVGVLERATPAFEPGTASAYHALTFGWLVGELVQRVTSLRLPEVVEAELAKPLGLDGLYIGAPDEARKRAAVLSLPRSRGPSPERYRLVARVVQTVNRTLRIPIDPSVIADGLFVPGGLEIYFHPRVLEVPMPAVNGLFTARSLARLYATLAGGGQLDGVRLLSEKTLARATQVQDRRLDRVVPVRMHWRLGYHRVFTTRGSVPSGFGHFGYGGSGAWADPRRDLAVAMVNNRVSGGPFGDIRMARIGAAAVRSVDRLSRKKK